MLHLPQQTSTLTPAPAQSDTIFGRIALHRSLTEKLFSAHDALEAATSAAEKRIGLRPFGLVAWREYSAIGGPEIDGARDRFLSEGADPVEIEREYADAKRRYRDRKLEIKAWDRKAGTGPLGRSLDKTRHELSAVKQSFIAEPATSAAGAAAVINYILDVCDGFEIEKQEQQIIRANVNALASTEEKI